MKKPIDYIPSHFDSEYFEDQMSRLSEPAQLRYVNAMRSAAAEIAPLPGATLDPGQIILDDTPVTPSRVADIADRDPWLHSQFVANYARGVGLFNVARRGYEMLATGFGADFEDDPEFDRNEYALKFQDIIPDSEMASVLMGEAPYDRARNEEHFLWLLSMRQLDHEWDRVISDNNILPNLAVGFAGQVFNPINYAVPMAAVRLGKAGMLPKQAMFMARQGRINEVARGFATAVIDETAIAATDYGDHGVAEAVAGIAMSTAFDTTIQGLLRAFGALPRPIAEEVRQPGTASDLGEIVIRESRSATEWEYYQPYQEPLVQIELSPDPADRTFYGSATGSVDVRYGGPPTFYVDADGVVQLYPEWTRPGSRQLTSERRLALPSERRLALPSETANRRSPERLGGVAEMRLPEPMHRVRLGEGDDPIVGFEEVLIYDNEADAQRAALLMEQQWAARVKHRFIDRFESDDLSSPPPRDDADAVVTKLGDDGGYSVQMRRRTAQIGETLPGFRYIPGRLMADGVEPPEGRRASVAGMQVPEPAARVRVDESDDPIDGFDEILVYTTEADAQRAASVMREQWSVRDLRRIVDRFRAGGMPTSSLWAHAEPTITRSLDGGMYSVQMRRQADQPGDTVPGFRYISGGWSAKEMTPSSGGDQSRYLLYNVDTGSYAIVDPFIGPANVFVLNDETVQDILSQRAAERQALLDNARADQTEPDAPETPEPAETQPTQTPATYQDAVDAVRVSGVTSERKLARALGVTQYRARAFLRQMTDEGIIVSYGSRRRRVLAPEGPARPESRDDAVTPEESPEPVSREDAVDAVDESVESQLQEDTREAIDEAVVEAVEEAVTPQMSPPERRARTDRIVRRMRQSPVAEVRPVDMQADSPELTARIERARATTDPLRSQAREIIARALVNRLPVGTTETTRNIAAIVRDTQSRRVRGGFVELGRGWIGPDQYVLDVKVSDKGRFLSAHLIREGFGTPDDPAPHDPRAATIVRTLKPNDIEAEIRDVFEISEGAEAAPQPRAEADDPADAEIVEKNLLPIASVLRRRGAGNEAEEIAAEAIALAWRQRARLEDPEADFFRFAMAIARFRQMHSWSRRKTEGGDAVDFEADQTPSFAEEVGDEDFLLRAAEVVNRVLGRATDDSARIFEMHYERGMTVSQISEATGKNESTIKSSLSRTRSAIATEMKNGQSVGRQISGPSRADVDEVGSSARMRPLTDEQVQRAIETEQTPRTAIAVVQRLAQDGVEVFKKGDIREAISEITGRGKGRIRSDEIDDVINFLYEAEVAVAGDLVSFGKGFDRATNPDAELPKVNEYALLDSGERSVEKVRESAADVIRRQRDREIVSRETADGSGFAVDQTPEARQRLREEFEQRGVDVPEAMFENADISNTDLVAYLRREVALQQGDPLVGSTGAGRFLEGSFRSMDPDTAREMIRQLNPDLSNRIAEQADRQRVNEGSRYERGFQEIEERDAEWERGEFLVGGADSAPEALTTLRQQRRRIQQQAETDAREWGAIDDRAVVDRKIGKALDGLMKRQARSIAVLLDVSADDASWAQFKSLVERIYTDRFESVYAQQREMHDAVSTMRSESRPEPAASPESQSATDAPESPEIDAYTESLIDALDSTIEPGVAITPDDVRSMAAMYEIDNPDVESIIVEFNRIREERASLDEIPDDYEASYAAPSRATVEAVTADRAEAPPETAFADISPSHRQFEENVIAPLLRSGVITEAHADFLRSVFGRARMSWADGLSVRSAEHLDADIEGAYWRKFNAIGIKKDLHNPVTVMLHELGHAAYYALPDAMRLEFDALWSSLEADPAMMRRFLGPDLTKRFGDAGYRQYIMSPSETFAELFAHHLIAKEAAAARPLIARMITYAIEHIARVYRRLVGTVTVGERLHADMQEIFNAAAGFRHRQLKASKRSAISNFLDGMPISMSRKTRIQLNKFGFYSRMELEAENLMSGPMPGLQLYAALKNRGVSTREMDYSGLTDWLTSKGNEKVSIDEVRAFVRENAPMLERQVVHKWNEIDYSEFDNVMTTQNDYMIKRDSLENEVLELVYPMIEEWVEPTYARAVAHAIASQAVENATGYFYSPGFEFDDPVLGAPVKRDISPEDYRLPDWIKDHPPDDVLLDVLLAATVEAKRLPLYRPVMEALERFDASHQEWRDAGMLDPTMEDPIYKKLTLPAASGRYRVVRLRSDRYVGPSHFGKGTLSWIRMTDTEIEGKSTAFLHEVQSDSHRSSPDQDSPWGKKWPTATMRHALMDAVEAGHETIMWPSELEDVAKIEGWRLHNITEDNGVVRVWDKDITPVVRWYATGLAREAEKAYKPYGLKPERRDVVTEDGFRHTFWVVDIPDEVRARVLEEGLPEFSRVPDGAAESSTDPATADDKYTPDDDPYHLIDETDVSTRDRRTWRSILTSAPRAVGKKTRERIGPTADPMIRFLHSPNRDLAALAHRLFRHATPIKGQRAVNPTVYQGASHSDTASAMFKRKRFAKSKLDHWTRQVVGSSSKTHGAVRRTMMTLTGGDQYTRSVWDLIDEMAQFYAVRKKHTGQSFSHDSTAAIIRKRITDRITEHDGEGNPSRYAAAGLDTGTLDIDMIVEAARDITETWRYEDAFGYQKQPVAISRRLDADNIEMPNLITILRLTENGSKADLLESTIARYKANPTDQLRSELDNLRVMFIREASRDRLSMLQYASHISSEVRKHAPGANNDQIARALWEIADPDLGIRSDPRITDAVRKVEASALDRSRLSFTKSVNIDADERVNRNLVWHLSRWYRERGIDSEEFRKAKTVDQKIARAFADLRIANARNGLMEETPSFNQAMQDITDAQHLLDEMRRLTNPVPSYIEDSITMLQTWTAVAFLARSFVATVVEVAQVTGTAAFNGHMRMSAMPLLASYTRHAQKVWNKGTPEERAAMQFVWESLDSLDPLRGNRALERDGVYVRSDLLMGDDEVMKPSFAQKLGYTMQSLTHIAAQVTLAGKIPVLERIPVLGELLKATTIGGAGAHLQTAATLMWSHAVFHYADHIGKMLTYMERHNVDMPTAVEELRNGTQRQYRPDGTLHSVTAGVNRKERILPGMENLTISQMFKGLRGADLKYISQLKAKIDAFLASADAQGMSGRERFLWLERNLGVVVIGNNILMSMKRFGDDMNAHNGIAFRFNRMINGMATQYSTTTPDMYNQPLNVTRHVFLRPIWQFLSHPVAFASQMGGKVGLMSLQGQALMIGGITTAAMIDKASRQWLEHGIEDGSDRIMEEWEERPLSFMADIVGRTSFLGLFEKAVRPMAAMIDGDSPFRVGLETENSVVPPVASYLSTLTEAIAAGTKLIRTGEVTPGEMRSIDRAIVARNTAIWTLLEQILTGNAPSDRYEEKPKKGRVISTPYGAMTEDGFERRSAIEQAVEDTRR